MDNFNIVAVQPGSGQGVVSSNIKVRHEEEKDIPEIAQELTALRSAEGELAATINTLANRLDPVLHPHFKEDNQKDTPNDSKTIIGENIHESRKKIEFDTTLLMRIIDRLEI